MLEIIIILVIIYFIFFYKTVENMSLICKKIETKDNKYIFDCNKKINVKDSILHNIQNNQAYNLIVTSKTNTQKNLNILNS